MPAWEVRDDVPRRTQLEPAGDCRAASVQERRPPSDLVHDTPTTLACERLSFFAYWQPLHNEDAHTALVFGYLRHAPEKHALEAWLLAPVGRTVRVPAPARDGFWPTYLSRHDEHKRTVPDLAFDAFEDDGEPLLV